MVTLQPFAGVGHPDLANGVKNNCIIKIKDKQGRSYF